MDQVNQNEETRMCYLHKNNPARPGKMTCQQCADYHKTWWAANKDKVDGRRKASRERRKLVKEAADRLKIEPAPEYETPEEKVFLVELCSAEFLAAADAYVEACVREVSTPDLEITDGSLDRLADRVGSEDRTHVSADEAGG